MQVEADQTNAMLHARDPQVVERLERQYGPLCMKIALQVLRDPRLAEEAVSETWYRAWDRGHTYSPDRAQLSTWLTKITYRKAIDILRVESRPVNRVEEPLQERASDEDLEEIAISSERAGVVRAAINQLPEAQRKAINLRYGGGLNDYEIAAAERIPLGTAKTRLLLARNKLKKSLAPLAKD